MSTKIFVTKYLFTRGILEVDAEIHNYQDGERKFAWVKSGTSFHGNDYHLTREAALLHAVTMIARKGKALRNQLAKLQKLETDINDAIKELPNG
jgi:hypothetical protein